MTIRHAVVSLAALAPLALAQDDRILPSFGGGDAKVLFLTHSAGFTHDVVRRVEQGKKALAERALADAARGQFVVEATQDCSAIDAKTLADVACVVFYTTGELPIPDAGKAALIDWIRQGGGFVGIHSATDTFYRFEPYGELIGGYFDGHPWHQDVRVLVEDPTHPAVLHLGTDFRITDEIYQFRNFSRERVHVLLRLDNDSVDVAKGKRDDRDYALAWHRPFGEGRMFYTALGHRPELWANPKFLRMVTAGIRWAMDARGQVALPPAGATVLFDGAGTDAWTHADGAACRWNVVDGALEVTPGKGDLMTRASFADFRLHVEFRTPLEPDRAAGQGRGNSGVYLQRRYEVQVLDSFGLPATANGCGALYGKRAPDVNASRAQGEWQSYDIVFRAARFDDAAEKTTNARVTVVHNGVLVHEDVEVDGSTGAGQPEGPSPGPILLQDHGHRVQYRNVWVVPAP